MVNRSLIYMAEFLNQEDLLEPVDRSLGAALNLMHPNGELVTELSGRQDQNTIGSMGVNWLALRYLAARNGNGVYAGLASRYQEEHGDLLQWLLLPQLRRESPAALAPAAAYEKEFREASIWRFRDGDLSATLLYKGYDRILAIRKGDVVVEAVRLASAFFGKGQFIAQDATRDENTFTMTQRLEGPYFQPMEPAEKIPSDPRAWASSRVRRRQSEVATLEQRCTLRREGSVFTLEISVSGTSNVPVSVELNVRNGVEIGGVKTAPMGADSFLTTNAPVLLKAGRHEMKVTTPPAMNGYTLVRGALPKLPGRSVYVTAQSPFRGSLVFA